MPPRRPDLLAPLAIVLILALGLAGYWLFPAALRFAQHHACIASGRSTDC
jgi:hypothetical protein